MGKCIRTCTHKLTFKQKTSKNRMGNYLGGLLMCIPALKDSKNINIFIGLDPFYCLVTQRTYKFLRKGTQAKVNMKF